MTDAELLTLADREASFLSAENNHCAAAVMRALADRLRDLRSPSFEEIKARVLKPEIVRDDRNFGDE